MSSGAFAAAAFGCSYADEDQATPAQTATIPNVVLGFISLLTPQPDAAFK